MSQVALAQSMKDDYGWRWSQPTVAAIESGERSLKLAEAVDLVSVLNLSGVEALIGMDMRARAAAAYRRGMFAEGELIRAAIDLYDSRKELDYMLSRSIRLGEPSPLTQHAFDNVELWTPVDVVRRAILGHEARLEAEANVSAEECEQADEHFRALDGDSDGEHPSAPER